MGELETGVVENRRFNFFEALVGVIVRPATAMRRIAAARPWPFALGLAVVIALVAGLANLQSPWNQVAPAPDPAGVLPPEYDQAMAFLQSPWLVVFNALLCSPALLAVGAGILFLIGGLLGGRGHYSALFSTQAFSSVPSLLLTPIVALLNLSGAVVAAVLTIPLSIGVGIWVIVLQVLGIRESLSLSTGRAIATVLIPIALLFGLACALIAVLIAVALPTMSTSP